MDMMKNIKIIKREGVINYKITQVAFIHSRVKTYKKFKRLFLIKIE